MKNVKPPAYSNVKYFRFSPDHPFKTAYNITSCRNSPDNITELLRICHAPSVFDESKCIFVTPVRLKGTKV